VRFSLGALCLVAGARTAWGDPAPPAPVDPVPAAPAAASQAPPVPSPVEMTAWIQVDAIPFDQMSQDELDPATRAPLNTEHVIVRRGRLRATYGRGDVRGVLELDGNTIAGPTARILLGYAQWSWPEHVHFDTTGQVVADRDPEAPVIAVTGGLFPMPFGIDVPRPDRLRIFLEPGWAQRAMFPGNDDGGVMASAAWRFARLSVAAMNGAPVGDAQWKGRDPTSSPDFMGRAGVDVDLDRGTHVRAGVSALLGTGLHPGTPPTKDQLTWNDANQNGVVDPTEIQVIPGSPGTPSQTFSRSALGADAAVDWCLRELGMGEAFVEGVIATNLDRAVIISDPTSAARDLRQLGYQVGVWQDLGTNARAGVRYDAYRPDRDASEVQGANIVGIDPRFATLSLLGTWRWTSGRLYVEYDHQRDPRGRGLDGQPTTRAADQLTVRAQVEW
jgi:hypothetical protein